jgi:stress-induced morphogen
MDEVINKDEVKRLICAAIPDAEVVVGEFGCGGDHLTVEISAPAFAGKTRIAQHQMVYAALRNHLDDGSIHALALKTTPKESGEK